MSSCIFTYYCLICSSCLSKKSLFKIADGSFSIYFTFIMMNLIPCVAFFLNVFSLFLPNLIDLLGKQGKNT